MPSFKILGQTNASPLVPQRLAVPPAGDDKVESVFKGAVDKVSIENADRNIHVWGKAQAVGAEAVVRVHFYDENDAFMFPSEEVTITTIDHTVSVATAGHNKTTAHVTFMNPGARYYRIFVVSATATFDVFGGRQP